MRATESVAPFVNAAAGTVKFGLTGGKYGIIYSGTGTGTVDVKVLSGDGVTYTPCGVTQITATTGYQAIDLPPGQYEAVIATFTANYLTITRIPGE